INLPYGPLESDSRLPYGPLESDSRYYIRRDADKYVFGAVHEPRGMVLVRGPKGTGKSSIINQLIASSKRGYSAIRILYVGFLGLDEKDFSSVPTLWGAILGELAPQLGLRRPGADLRSLENNPQDGLEAFFNQCLVASKNTPLLVCFDEIDREFDKDLDEETRTTYFKVRVKFFTKVRALWSNGAHHETLKKVRWLLAYSSEPKFFVP